MLCIILCPQQQQSTLPQNTTTDIISELRFRNLQKKQVISLCDVFCTRKHLKITAISERSLYLTTVMLDLIQPSRVRQKATTSIYYTDETKLQTNNNHVSCLVLALAPVSKTGADCKLIFSTLHIFN